MSSNYPPPPPEQAPQQDFLSSPLAQLLIPLAATAASAISPRYGAPAAQAGLGALGAMQNYRTQGVRLQELMAASKRRAATDQQFSGLLADASGGHAQAPNAGNVPAATSALQTNALEEAAPGGTDSPGVHATAAPKPRMTIDPNEARALQMQYQVDPPGALRRLSEVLSKPAPEQKQIDPHYHWNDFQNDQGDLVTSRIDDNGTQTQFLRGSAPPKAPEKPQVAEHAFTDASGNEIMSIVDKATGQVKNVPLGKARQQANVMGDPEADAKFTAHALATGDLSALRDVSSMRGGQRMHIFALAKQENPTFSLSDLNRKIEMQSQFTNGKEAQNLQSFGTFLAHAGEASDASDALHRSGIPALNKPLNYLMQNYQGSPELQRFMTALEPVRKEYEGFLLGGHAMYGDDRKAVETILSNNASPDQIKAALNQMGNTAKARYDQVNFRYKKTMGKDLENPFSDEAMAGAHKIGVDLGAAPAGLGGPAQTQAAPQTFKHTATNPETKQRMGSNDGVNWQPIQ